MIDRKYHRSLHVFSWVACTAMAAKLIFFTEYNSRRLGQPHGLTPVQEYADRKLDEFFGVQKIAEKAATTEVGAPAKPSA